MSGTSCVTNATPKAETGSRFIHTATGKNNPNGAQQEQGFMALKNGAKLQSGCAQSFDGKTTSTEAPLIICSTAHS